MNRVAAELYGFIIKHLPGSKKSARDALSENVDSLIVLSPPRRKDITLLRRIYEGSADDGWPRSSIAWFLNGNTQHCKTF